MSKYQRTKGHNGERTVVKFWKELFPKARRVLEYQKEFADNGIDVQIQKNVLETQVKVGQQVPSTIYKYIKQMKPNPQAWQFVQCKRDNKKWLVILDAEDFKEIISILKTNGII